jgi:glucose/mannose-6-phosphate isomerase
MSLDDLTYIRSLDLENQLGSIHLLGKQLIHGWETGAQIDIPDSYKDVDNIVFCGMGGTSLGAYVTKHTYGLTLGKPYEIINDYHLPSYVNERTLVIVQSYSGDTEESLSGFEDGIAMKGKLFTISAGGELQKRAEAHGNPHFSIVPTYNPCNQPRMAIGYSIVAQLALLHRLGFIHISDEELADVTRMTDLGAEQYREEVPTEQNKAKQMAWSLLDKIPIYIAGEFLQGAIHAMRNQIHENAKTFAAEHPIPEMGHHLLEALSYPVSTKDFDMYIFIESNLYSERITQRTTISKSVVEEAGHAVASVQAAGSFKLSQILSTIQFGAYVGLYLALLEGINPSPIPHVDKLKKLLAK